VPRPSKREPIVEAGLRLVHRDGFTGTGVAAIAAAGGAPKGSFYNHFASKDEFGVAALDRYFDGVRAALGDTIGDDARPPVERVRAYFLLLREIGEPDHARGCLIGNLSAEAAPASAAIRARLADFLEEWTDAIAVPLAEGQRRGDVRADLAPDTIAALLLDAWQGALLRAKVTRSAAPLDAFLDVLYPTLILPAA
jgi:TetR/AcrR family transcriptional repressor of nem operon